jgi:RNA polymerase primary sigma factor
MPTSTQVMTLFMNEVGSYPRLSREQERALAFCAARGRAARRELRQTPPPGVKRSLLLQALVARGESAQRRLVECNLRLVIYWARRHNPYGLPLEDLIQEGNIGLIKAVERYDPRQGTRLSTYARWWIRKALYQAAADMGPLIRLPEKTNRERLRVRHASTRLEIELARTPTLAELAARVGLSQARVASLRRWDRAYVSMDAPLATDTQRCLADVLPDRQRPSPDETVTRRALRDHMRQEIRACLAPSEQAYLGVRFGLDGLPPRSRLQAARHLGMTQEAAARLEKSILRRLRQSRTLRHWVI